MQRVLAKGRPELETHGVYYPKSIGVADHMPLAKAVRRRAARGKISPQEHEAIDYSEDVMKREFIAEMAALPESIKTVVISKEDFCHMVVSDEEFAALRVILEPHFDPIEIVVYLRRQDQHYASLYSEALRIGQIMPPQPVREIFGRSTYYDYDVLLDRWAAHFPEATITPRIFERPLSGHFDAVEDLFEVIGCPVPPLPNDKITQSNISINPSGQKMLFELGTMLKTANLNKFAYEVLWGRIAATAGRMFAGKGWQMSRNDADAFMVKYLEGNERTRERWFAQRETLFLNDEGGSETAWPDDSETLKAASAMIIDFCHQIGDEKFERGTTMVRLGRKHGDKQLERQGLHLRTSAKPDSAESILVLARRHLAQQEFGKAKMAVLRALTIEPQNEIAQKLQKEIARQKPQN